jgi:bacterial/archaeal transporter family-2 protein
MGSAAVLMTIGMGTLLAMQVGVNGVLRDRTNSAILAAMISTATSTSTLLVVTLLARERLPATAQLTSAPWWIWTGGLMGALYVALAPVMADRLGGSFFFALVILGQMLAALVIDHFGLLGLPPEDINLPKVIGAGLLVVGVVLIRGV